MIDEIRCIGRHRGDPCHCCHSIRPASSLLCGLLQWQLPTGLHPLKHNLTHMTALAEYCAREYQSGRSQQELSRELNISKSSICRLVKRGAEMLPTPVQIHEQSRPLIDRIMMRTRHADNGCLEWTGPRKNTGYAQFSYKGKNYLVHRLVYNLTSGEIPDGLVIDHICGNKLCVNRSHLRAVTQSMNLRTGRRWQCAAS